MIIAMSIFMLYSLMIAMFGKEVGLLFATIFLSTLIILMKLSEITGLDKKIDEFLEKE